MQTVKIFDSLDLIMLQIQHGQSLKHFQTLNFLDVKPLKMNRLQLQNHGYFLFRWEGVGHAHIERCLSDEIDADLVLLIQALVVVLFGFGDLLLLECGGYEVGMLRREDGGVHGNDFKFWLISILYIN